MLDVYARMDEEALRREARCHQGACDDGDLDADDLRWTLVAELPLAVIEGCISRDGPSTREPRARWRTWFEAECDMLEEEIGDDADWRRLASEEVSEPIVVTVKPDRVQIWDGWHRTGGSFAAGRSTIPAIVGVRPEHLGVDPLALSAPFRSDRRGYIVGGTRTGQGPDPRS